jgi:predicted TIM-barrel fold metal-dependent hydrolase
MLLDINAYVGHWPFKQVKFNTCEALMERMDHFGVDISVISNLNGIFYKNTQPANEELFEELQSKRRFQDLFIPFAVINPNYADWKNDFEICIDKLGMKGIRLYPKYHDYELTDPDCIELIKLTQDRGLPIAFSFRMVDSRQRSWLDIEHEWDLKDIVSIVKEVPDAKYIFLNLANSTKTSDEEEEILKKANIMFDTAGRSINTLPELLERFGVEKFAFGTHSPILDYLTGLLRIESLREDEANEEMKDLMKFGNAKRILDIKSGP